MNLHQKFEINILKNGRDMAQCLLQFDRNCFVTCHTCHVILSVLYTDTSHNITTFPYLNIWLTKFNKNNTFSITTIKSVASRKLITNEQRSVKLDEFKRSTVKQEKLSNHVEHKRWRKITQDKRHKIESSCTSRPMSVHDCCHVSSLRQWGERELTLKKVEGQSHRERSLALHEFSWLTSV